MLSIALYCNNNSVTTSNINTNNRTDILKVLSYLTINVFKEKLYNIFININTEIKVHVQINVAKKCLGKNSKSYPFVFIAQDLNQEK